MLFVSLLAVAAAVVSASPIESQAKPIHLSLKHVNTVKSVKNVVQHGQARINKVNGVAAISSGTVTNELVSYLAPVIIGGKTWQLIVDTGCKSLSPNAPLTLY